MNVHCTRLLELHYVLSCLVVNLVLLREQSNGVDLLGDNSQVLDSKVLLLFNNGWSTFF